MELNLAMETLTEQDMRKRAQYSEQARAESGERDRARLARAGKKQVLKVCLATIGIRPALIIYSVILT